MISTTAVCMETELRLVGGTRSSEGRIEICRLEAWSTICDNLWSPEEAQVACRQLGYSRYSEYGVFDIRTNSANT